MAQKERLLSHERAGKLARVNRSSCSLNSPLVQIEGVYSRACHDESTLTCFTLWMCCKDFVGPLDKEQRVNRLALGYIRENCQYEFPLPLLQQCTQERLHVSKTIKRARFVRSY